MRYLRLPLPLLPPLRDGELPLFPPDLEGVE